MKELTLDLWAGGKPVKGTYHITQITEVQRRVLTSCPGCGKIHNLNDHIVDNDGFVRPSLDCTSKECDFHESVRLADWSPVRGGVPGYRPTWSGGGSING